LPLLELGNVDWSPQVKQLNFLSRQSKFGLHCQMLTNRRFKTKLPPLTTSSGYPWLYWAPLPRTKHTAAGGSIWHVRST
jgi:hypothetical protein